MGAAPPPAEQQANVLMTLLTKLVTLFGPTDAILIAIIVGMFLFFTGVIPNPVLQRVQHVDRVVSRLCSHQLCKPDDDICKEACWH